MDAHTVFTHQSAKPSAASHSTSSHTVGNLPRITNTELRELILSDHQSLSVIDVRDSDYIGGHIKGCTNVPSPDLDWKLPELVRKSKDTKVVVFHCALSQQRGPAAALRYLRERERMFPKAAEESTEGDDVKTTQQVYVLKGGFFEWQKKYGDDERVTEEYRKEVWEDAY